MRADIVVGAVFPDYELPDHTNTPRRLSFLQGDDPMVLMLSRGFYCAKERQQLHDMVQFSKHCAVGYTRLVTITTDTLEEVNDLRQGVGADWTFLYDDMRVVQQDLDIQEYTDPYNDPMIPYTFVLEPGLRIFKIYEGYWFWGRPTTHELHLDLREITRRIRPDWRIDVPELRAKWNRGERDGFFPYDKSLEQAFIRAANAVDRFE
ncbi:MAG: redoxin domain-containing protein [Dehalococcoidales bacterium]|nr:redoxin domain-containing protein [Dehalococcoidales bacterium]